MTFSGNQTSEQLYCFNDYHSYPRSNKNRYEKKVEEIRLNEAGIYRIEETRMIEQKGNWFVVRNKPFKQQVKWKVELILREITLHIMYSTHT